jgi:hypothetical protein
MDRLTSLIKKSDQRSATKLSGFGMSPAADWKIILVASTLLALLLTAFNVFIFIMIDKGEIFAGETLPEEQATLDIRELRETVRYYQGKALQLENLKKATSTTFSDPSI